MARIFERRRDQNLKRIYVDVDKRERTYLLHIPKSEAPKEGYPVIFVLHGGGGRASGTSITTAFHSHKLGKKFIVVYPDAVELNGKRNWADRRTVTVQGREAFSKVDDVGFLCFILDSLIKSYKVNQKRVFSTGISNGAFMSQTFAAEKSDRIAAIAPAIGGMAESVGKNFKPKFPVSVLLINGTKDPLVPYEGGYVRFGKQKLGKTLSVDEIVNLWVKHNGCQKNPKVEKLPDRDKTDGSQVVKYTYGNGRLGSKVLLLKIIGGGHNWPGARKYAPQFLIGKTCYDLNATDYVIRFFLQF